jgi:hypothetical protein
MRMMLTPTPSPTPSPIEAPEERDPLLLPEVSEGLAVSVAVLEDVDAVDVDEEKSETSDASYRITIGSW